MAPLLNKMNMRGHALGHRSHALFFLKAGCHQQDRARAHTRVYSPHPGRTWRGGRGQLVAGCQTWPLFEADEAATPDPEPLLCTRTDYSQLF